MTFADDLKKAQAAKLPHEDVSVLLGGALHTLRFTQMDGFTWANETDKHPARVGVPLDAQFGYNVRSLTVSAALLSGARLEGEQGIPLSKDEWSALFTTITGSEFKAITDAIWGLNEYRPQIAVADALEKVKKTRARSPKASA